MAVDFFGQYLVAHRIVTTEHLMRAVLFQKKSNRLLGELAIEQHVLTPQQVELAKAEQAKRDVLFGDAIIALGFATKAQVDALLALQKKSHLYLGDAIVRLGLAPADLIKKALIEFQAIQQLATKDQNMIKFAELPNRVHLEPFVVMAQKSLTRHWQTQSNLGDQTLIKPSGSVPLFKFGTGVAVEAPFRGTFIMTASDRVLMAANKRRDGLLGDLLPTSSDASLLAETLMDMTNTIVKLATESFRARHVLVKHGATEKQPRAVTLSPTQTALTIELHTPDGPVHLAFIFD